jgi:hypothetical protein
VGVVGFGLVVWLLGWVGLFVLVEVVGGRECGRVWLELSICIKDFVVYCDIEW